MPYIDKICNSQVRASLERSGFISTRLVNRRPKPIEQITSAKPPIQQRSLRKCPDAAHRDDYFEVYETIINYVVYQVTIAATCNICGNSYIDSTTRPLHCRALIEKVSRHLNGGSTLHAQAPRGTRTTPAMMN